MKNKKNIVLVGIGLAIIGIISTILGIIVDSTIKSIDKDLKIR